MQVTKLSGYDYEPERKAGLFIRLKAKGDKVKFRIASTPIHWKEMTQFSKEPKERFAWIVWLREQNGQIVNEPKIFTAGVAIYSEIKELAINPDWGDPTEYDVTITRTEASTANYYSVVPSPTKTPLTKEETDKIKEAKIDLVAIVEKKGVKAGGTSTFGEGGKPVEEVPTPESTEEVEEEEMPF